MRLVPLVLLAAVGAALHGQGRSDWRPGKGDWADASRWSRGVPDVRTEGWVGGDSDVVVRAGDFVAGMLGVGVAAGDRSRVVVDGGSLLLRQDSLRIGEHTGSEGSVLVRAGALESAMDVFVGAVTGSSHRMTRASLAVQGGIVLGLDFTVGEGLGSTSRLEVDGSRAEAVHALEYVYLFAHADPGGTPAHTTLAFHLDERGVTPITIQSRWDGLRIECDAASRCLLEIGLLAAPPPGNITLVHANVAPHGTFSELPEGATVRARWGGTEYEWKLTYRGNGGHDLVLLGNGTTAPFRAKPAPIPLWAGKPVFPLAISAGTPAFAGAEGYGADAAGGRGGANLVVQNLHDDGPGSLRAALRAEGPRSVTFGVAGTIELKTPIEIDAPFLTLDGSRGVTLTRHGLEVRTHDVVLRQFHIRIGDADVRRGDRNVRYAAGDGEYALQFTEGAENCIADHLSLSWSTNKILSTTKLADRITVQWCILSESLNLDGHGYASIAGGNRVTWHHNLFAHNNSRNVRFQGAVDADFRNNVVYDWGHTSAYGEFDRLNYVGNYLKPGPSTTQHPPLFHTGEEVVLPHSLYLAGNVLAGNPAASRDNWRGSRFYFDRETLAAAAPFPAPAVVTEPAAAARDRVLAQAGATLPARDRVDARIVREVETGTGHLIDAVPGA